jgi:hypothetical protein
MKYVRYQKFMPQVFDFNKHPNLMINVIEYFLFILFRLFYFIFIHNRNYIMSCYLFKEGLIFPAFTLKLMLLFIIMNMFNSRVYFIRQNASTPDGKVFAPAEYAVTPNHARGGIRASQCGLRPLRPVRAYYKPSAPIMTRPRKVVFSPCP